MTSVWVGMLGFVLAAGEFFAKIGEIDRAVQVQETSVKGYTQNKKKAKENMAGKALKIAGALKKYATNIGDNALFEAVNFTESELLYATDTLVRERCLLIYAKAVLYYAADSAGEGWNGMGTPILPGQEVIHTVTVAEFKAFMNGYVQGPNVQVFEVTIF